MRILTSHRGVFNTFAYLPRNERERNYKILSTMNSIIRLSLGLIIAVALFSSCKKLEDTIAVVQVRTVDGFAVDSAYVEIFGEGSASQVVVGEIRIELEDSTDASGKAVFDLTDFYEAGQSGFVVLNIEVTKDSLFTEGLIKVEPEETTEEIIILQ